MLKLLTAWIIILLAHSCTQYLTLDGCGFPCFWNFVLIHGWNFWCRGFWHWLNRMEYGDFVLPLLSCIFLCSFIFHFISFSLHFHFHFQFSLHFLHFYRTFFFCLCVSSCPARWQPTKVGLLCHLSHLCAKANIKACCHFSNFMTVP